MVTFTAMLLPFSVNVDEYGKAAWSPREGEGRSLFLREGRCRDATTTCFYR